MLNRLFSTLIFLVSFQLLAPAAFAETATMERVRYCSNGFGPDAIQNQCLHSEIVNPKYQAFDDAGVTDRGQRNMYISVLSQPDPANVKKVVFLSAGQQIENPFDGSLLDWGAGWPNFVVGQPDNYKTDCFGKVSSCAVDIDSRSLAAKMRASGKFDSDDTLFVMAHDLRFGYFQSSSDKDAIENAWWNFLTTKFDPTKIDLMVLAGQSRGGCMMFRLGKRFRADPSYADIPLAVQGYDPVCTTTETTMGMSAELPLMGVRWFENPLNEDYKSLAINMDQVFPPNKRKNLSVLDIHGGAPVTIPNARSFTWKSQNTDLGWWKQTWVNEAHSDMGGDPSVLPWTINVGFPHLMAFCNRLEQDKLNRARRMADLKRKRLATPAFPVDFNGDRLSDVLLRVQDPNQGLQLRTRMSNGDGTFGFNTHNSGDGNSVNSEQPLVGFFNEDRMSDVAFVFKTPQDRVIIRTKFSLGDGSFSASEVESSAPNSFLDLPVLAGDVNGDGLTDIIFQREQQAGLRIMVSYSNGDGTFRATSLVPPNVPVAASTVPQGEIDSVRSATRRTHAADIDGDGKTDIIVHFWHPEHGFIIHSYRSDGTGKFAFRQYRPGAWHSYDYFHSFVGDVNRDGKSDLIVMHRYSGNGEIVFKTFISGQFFGYFDRVITQTQYGEGILDFDAFVADVNGDRRTDIVLRKRDTADGLQFISKLSLGDGTYNDVTFSAGDGPFVDAFPELVGNFNGGRTGDILLRDRPSIYGMTATTKMGLSNGSFGHTIEQWGDSDAIDALPAITGPIYWNGGATFGPCRTAACRQNISVESASAEIVGGLADFSKPEVEGKIKPVMPEFFKSEILATDKADTPNQDEKVTVGDVKSGGSSLTSAKTCAPLVTLANGNYELTCELTVTATGQNPNGYVVLADLFAGQNPNAQPSMGPLPFQTNFSSSDPWNCGSVNPQVEGCEISVADLNAAGGSSIITSTTTFQNPDGFDQAFNCLVADASKTPVLGSANKSEQFSGLAMNKSDNADNPSSQFGDVCVVLDIPAQQDNPEKLESVKFEKKCETPTQGAHNGAQGYFWNCTIEARVQPSPFNGTFTITEDASNISAGQAEFISASMPCNGIGTDVLTCELDGNTMAIPQVLDVQLFTEIVTNDERIDWQNCVTGRAETSVATMNSGKTCFQTIIKPEVVKDPPKFPDPKELAVKKACEAEPFAMTHDGVEGIGWRCVVTVVANPAPFAGDFTFIEDASSISGTSDGEIISMTPQNSAWNCASNLPAVQTSCDISGADFDASGEETLEVTLFAPTGNEPIKWENCVSGAYASQDGEKAEIKGNCEAVSWEPPVINKEPPKLSLAKTCEGPTAFGGGKRYVCSISVNNTGGPVTDDMTLEELFQNVTGAPATNYLLQLQGTTGWACEPAPFAGGATCDITAANFNANNGHTITGTFLIPNAELIKNDFENCAVLRVGDQIVAEAPCVPIDEEFGETTFDIEKVCKAAGPRQEFSEGNWVQSYACTLTVTTNGVPFSHPLLVADAMSYGTFSGNALVGQLTSNDPWQCVQPPYAAPGQGNQPACIIQGNDFPHANGSSSINFVMNIQGNVADQYGAQNCGNLYTSIPTDSTEPPVVAQSCVTIVEPPVVEDPTLNVAKVCSPAVAAANGNAPWTVQCVVTISGTNLPAGQQIRITDELTGAGLNVPTGGGFNQGLFTQNCGNAVVSNGIGEACDITTDDITNNGGSISFPYTGTISGPGGRMLPDLKYPQNCAFASIPGIGLNAPASGKVCVQIPVEPGAVGGFNDNVFVPNPDLDVLTAEDSTAVLDPSIFTPVPNDGDGGSAASCSLDTLYVVDRSGSMAGNRMNQVKAALAGAYAAFEGNGSASSLISFHGTSQILVNPAQVLPSAVLTQITQSIYAGGGTNWQAGFAAAENVVFSATKKPLVFFITDGYGLAVNPQTISAIRGQGSRIIGMIIGNGLPGTALSNVLGPNLINANSNTQIDPFSTDVIMIDNPADSLSVFQKIEDAYCPGSQKSASPTLLAAQKLLQNIPVSTQQYAGDDEPFEDQTSQDLPKPTVQPQLVLKTSSAGQCSVNGGNRTYECPFDIEITNTGNQPYLGPLVTVGDFGEGGLKASQMSGRGWQLEQYDEIGILALHGNLVLAPGQAANIKTMVTVGGQSGGGLFENCAILGHPNVETDSKWANMLLQQVMNARGLNVGTVDGKIGPNTLKGLARLREQLGLPASDRIDSAIFEKLGLGKQLAGTQSCATVPLPPIAAQVTPPSFVPEQEEPEEFSAPTPTLTCDLGTTVQRGNACVCRFSRMLQTSPSSCGCIRGHELTPGEGCFRPTNDNVTPRPVPETTPRPIPTPEPAIICDRQSTRQRGDSCVCKIPGGVMISQTQCACPKGTRLDNREGCVKLEEVPKPRPTPEPQPALKCDLSTSKADRDRCVCLYERMTPINATSCACPAGTKLEAGVGCIAIGRPQKPNDEVKEVRPRKPVAE